MCVNVRLYGCGSVAGHKRHPCRLCTKDCSCATGHRPETFETTVPSHSRRQGGASHSANSVVIQSSTANHVRRVVSEWPSNRSAPGKSTSEHRLLPSHDHTVVGTHCSSISTGFRSRAAANTTAALQPIPASSSLQAHTHASRAHTCHQQQQSWQTMTSQKKPLPCLLGLLFPPRNVRRNLLK